MDASLDITRLPYYKPSPLTSTYLVPVRHACGYVLYADLNSEYVLFYTRHDVTGYRHILLTGKSPISKCTRCEYPLSMDWLRPLWHIEPMPYHLAILTKARRVCSNCWGPLDTIGHMTVEGSTEDHTFVWCSQCKYETIGYVTNRYATEAIRSDKENFELCKTGLAEALGIELPAPRARQTQTKNLHELGF